MVPMSRSTPVTVRKMSLAESISHADIRVTALHEWGVALGAATLVLESDQRRTTLGDL